MNTNTLSVFGEIDTVDDGITFYKNTVGEENKILSIFKILRWQ
jgi:hypothetical protein